jgi:phage-related holin
MKTFIFAKVTLKLCGVVTLLDITKHLILPKLSLLVWLCLLMVADLITGLLRAKLTKQKITSERLRRSVIKFLQYFGSIGVVIVLTNQNKDNEHLVLVLNWAQDGVAILIIYIEALSIFENLYAMDKKNPFAMYFIRPIYWLLSWSVRRNPVQDQADKLQQDPGEKMEEP